MEAVKRAYAEIILNTAAESAARILASERKALAFQRSLASAKQQALDLLLRLKSLMDAKVGSPLPPFLFQLLATRNQSHLTPISSLLFPDQRG